MPFNVPTIEQRAMLQQVLARMRGGTQAAEPVRIDRYEFVRRLGVGGMGIVYLVRDPELDRLLALKLLHPSLAAADDVPAVEQRMRNEARAMARLDHPNVVRVLEVGEHEGRTYIAMEYVEGTTLTHWLAARPKLSWREIVSVFLAAGEGLAAAHAAGLAHCDFKPDNVLVGDSGAVRVTDFGLVRAYAGALDELSTTIDGPLRARVDGSSQVSHLVGTPSFMAPEQFEGRRGTPHSDQFSFCVALFAALHRQSPFAGDTLEQLRRSVQAGVVTVPTTGPRVPPTLDRVIARGLAVDPDARWPELGELLAAMRRILDAPRRRIRLAALGLAAGIGLTVAGARLHAHHDRSQRIDACVAEGERIGEIWNDDTRTRLRDALLASDARFAERTAAGVIGTLDRQARDWAHVRTEACLDASVRGEWDADTLDRSRWCLDGQRMGLELLIDALLRPGTALGRVQHAAGSMPHAGRCRDPLHLRSIGALPSDRAAVAAVERQAWQSWALLEFGSFDEGLRVAREAERAADELGWEPLSAKVHALIGQLSMHLGDHATAEATLEDAYFEALHAGADDIALQSAISLVRVVHDRRDALRWARHAELLLAGSGGMRRVPLLQNLATVHLRHGDYDRAHALLEQVLALLEPQLGPHHPAVARALMGLGEAAVEAGAFERAEAHFRRALRVQQDAHGPEHPFVAISLCGLGRALTELGRLDEARVELERALEIEEQAFGPEHARLVRPLELLADTLERMGEYEQAMLLRERARAIRT